MPRAQAALASETGRGPARGSENSSLIPFGKDCEICGGRYSGPPSKNGFSGPYRVTFAIDGGRFRWRYATSTVETIGITPEPRRNRSRYWRNLAGGLSILT